MAFYIGLDLGQSQDYTALSVIDRWPNTYQLVHLERYPLGTLYPDIVERVVDLIDSPELQQAKLQDESVKKEKPTLVIDGTGVGRPVTDLFRAALGERAILRSVLIHGGATTTHDGGYSRVPKRELISRAVALMQSGELRIARDLALTPTLVQELRNFKVKINVATGHDSYEAWREGQHDDLVLAACLSLWGASRAPRPKFRAVSVGQRGR